MFAEKVESIENAESLLTGKLWLVEGSTGLCAAGVFEAETCGVGKSASKALALLNLP